MNAANYAINCHSISKHEEKEKRKKEDNYHRCGKKIHTMCLMAMSSDFFEIVLPNPLFSVAFIMVCMACCPLLNKGTFEMFSGIFFRVTTGNEILLFELKVAAGSELGDDLTVKAIPGRALPAETGRSGSLVFRFGGVSVGKSGISSGPTGVRGRRLGELGRDEGAEL